MYTSQVSYIPSDTNNQFILQLITQFLFYSSSFLTKPLNFTWVYLLLESRLHIPTFYKAKNHQ